MKKIVLIVSATIFLSALVTGCFNETAQEKMLKQAVAIESADECHLCGMLIANFSGPKGETVEKAKQQVDKFCSTRDMFAYYLQPENKQRVTQLFVHDMSKMPWDELNDGHFIDATTAWYVTGSSKHGAMGQTLASFSQQQDANAFAKEFGGQVLVFEQVNLDNL